MGQSERRVEVEGWTAIQTLTLTEEVRTVSVNMDSSGASFACKEILIRQFTTCSESSIQNMSIYVNNSPVIGNMPMIKNTGGLWSCWRS